MGPSSIQLSYALRAASRQPPADASLSRHQLTPRCSRACSIAYCTSEWPPRASTSLNMHLGQRRPPSCNSVRTIYAVLIPNSTSTMHVFALTLSPARAPSAMLGFTMTLDSATWLASGGRPTTCRRAPDGFAVVAKHCRCQDRPVDAGAVSVRNSRRRRRAHCHHQES